MNKTANKFINRLLSAAAAATFVLTTVSVPVYADAGEEMQTVFLDDFSAYSDGSAPIGWTITDNTTMNVQGGALTVDQTFVANVTAENNAVKQFDQISGKIIVEAEYDLSAVTKGEMNMLYAYGTGGLIYNIIYRASSKSIVYKTTGDLWSVSSYSNSVCMKTEIDTAAQKVNIYLKKSGESYSAEPNGKDLSFNNSKAVNLN